MARFIICLCLMLSILPTMKNAHQVTSLVEQTGEPHQDIYKQVLQLSARITEQNVAIADMKVVIADMKVVIADMKVVIADQNVVIADQNTRFADQNTKLAEQTTKIFQMKAIVMKLSDLIQYLNKPDARKPATNDSDEILLNPNRGTTFTRWGRTDCPSNISHLVYSGYVGGSSHTHTGGAVNYICMPPDPLWNVNRHFNGPYWGYVYGGEYEQIPDSTLMNHEVPCAVCETTSFSKKIMLPGRNRCYPGWQEAYHGELSSGCHNHPAASEYVCLDAKPQTSGSNANQNGVLFYPVKTVCGSLPCPPYENNRLLTCVVCLK